MANPRRLELDVEIAARIKEWQNAGRFQEAIQEAKRRGDEAVTRLREARRIDEESLYEPVTL
jgi:hypothetical protein